MVKSIQGINYNYAGNPVRISFADGGSINIADLGTKPTSGQPYKFGGKELLTANELNEYDFGARRYFQAVPHFTSVDPLCKVLPFQGRKWELVSHSPSESSGLTRLLPSGQCRV